MNVTELSSIVGDDPDDIINGIIELWQGYSISASRYTRDVEGTVSCRLRMLILMAESGWHVPAEGVDLFLENVKMNSYDEIVSNCGSGELELAWRGVKNNDLDNCVPQFVRGAILKIKEAMIGEIEAMVSEGSDRFKFYKMITGHV